MDFQLNLVTHLVEVLSTYRDTQQIWLAYSGGLDSQVLLHAIAQLRSQLPQQQLRAVHIHHGLHPQADHWANHCQAMCQAVAIPCEIIHVQVRQAPRESLEANARTARYQAIAQLLDPADIVLTAQHADDQAETVLLQLFRGAGVAGLAAMPVVTRLAAGWLIRPLLNYTRAQLYAYAQQVQLQWIEDSSNADVQFDRNFLRHQIIPHLQQRWSGISQTLSRVARHQAEAHELLQDLAKIDWETCRTKHLSQLNLAALAALSPARQRQVIRYWLNQCQLPIPSSVQLQQLLHNLVSAKTDRQPVVRWRGVEVRRYRQLLFAMPPLPPQPAISYQLTWSLPQVLALPLGQLSAILVSGQGLALPSDTVLQVRFRQGGEIFHWHGHQRVVKKLLQGLQLPPWQRHFIPLIYLNNTLVAIPKIGVRDELRASAGQMGWEIRWQWFTDYS
jgi:tRNA(Ile)-lysidine synthase